jgi:hypothetical protein
MQRLGKVIAALNFTKPYELRLGVRRSGERGFLGSEGDRLVKVDGCNCSIGWPDAVIDC